LQANSEGMDTFEAASCMGLRFCIKSPLTTRLRRIKMAGHELGSLECSWKLTDRLDGSARIKTECQFKFNSRKEIIRQPFHIVNGKLTSVR
jgi:hypothetical protein